MSVGHWKLLNQLKDIVTKSKNENSAFYTLNREWIALLQKIPYVFSQVEISSKINPESGEQNRTVQTGLTNDLSKSVSKEVLDIEPLNDVKPYSLPKYLNGIKNRINPKVKDSSEDGQQQWKPKKDIISETGIASRTKYVVSSITAAQSSLSKLKRLEDLTKHLNQYPEAKNLAVKEGAIKILLHLRHETEDEPTLSALREAFALLGYIEPLPCRGIRILSIDGGGIRGILAIEMLKRLEELSGRNIYELFDYICGVSTGAILAASIGAQRKNLDDVTLLYKGLSTKIFTQNTFRGTSNLVWSHSYYDTEMWESLLKLNLGDKMLIDTAKDPLCPKISAVSTVVNKARVMAYIFRSYSLPHRVQSQYMGSHQHKVWEAVRASAAAPLYFEEFKLGDLLHQDGGILVNNPTAVAIHEARQLWPNSPIQCVVSLGTGRFNPVHNYKEESNTSSSSWKTKFMKILDSATDTEAVHTMLNDLLPGTIYHRFNPYITEMVTMDEISPDKISQLEMDAAMYYRRNEDKFHETVRALLEKRSGAQHCKDWINLQRDLLGIN